jgi:predicted nucleic acid-binding protein
MNPQVVCDAGPLITFARGGRLDVLRQVLGTVLIPSAVRREVVDEGTGKPGAAEIHSATWVETRELGSHERAVLLPASLGEGERQAVALCIELGACLLADDPVARREARARGIPLISTLDVLDEAKVQGLIQQVKATLDHLIRTGFRLRRSLYYGKLSRAGEPP